MVESFVKWVDRAASLLSAVMLFILMIITFVDVAGRNLFNHPLTGASELTELFVAGVVFFMLPKVALTGKHIVIDIIDPLVSAGVRRALDVFASLLAAGLFFVIGKQLFATAARAAEYGDTTAALGLPLAPILAALAVMSVVNGLAHLLSIFAGRKTDAEGAQFAI